jgi:hypothetical protein
VTRLATLDDGAMTRHTLRALLAGVGVLATPAQGAQPASSAWQVPVTTTPVFTSGEGGCAAFRIPGTTATDHTILVFAECRRYSCADFGGQHDIVLKRSTDGGVTFGPLAVVASPTELFNCTDPTAPGACAFWDPTPVWDPSTGAVTLLAHYADSDDDRLLGNGAVFSWRSEDEGETWAGPTNLTDALGGHPLPTPGNGHGIFVSSTGRLVVAGYFHEKTGGVAAVSFLSDDGGVTWSLGQRSLTDVPGGVSEPDVVELFADGDAAADDDDDDVTIGRRADRQHSPRNAAAAAAAAAAASGGAVVAAPLTKMTTTTSPPKLLLNTRQGKPGAPCGDGVQHCRLTATSADGGVTWSNATTRPDLPDPGCKGGIARWEQGRGLLFVNDATVSVRRNVTLRVSKDNGATFPWAVQVSAPELLAGYADVVTQNWAGGNGTELAVVAFEVETCNVSVALVQPSLVVAAKPPS